MTVTTPAADMAFEASGQVYKQTYAGVIDEIARREPSRIFAEYLDPPYLPEGSVHILSYKDLANAINRLSWWMTQRFDELGIEKGDVVCFIGLPDLRYQLMAVAAMKCRVKVLFSAPTNDLSTHIRLINETKCKALLYTKEAPLVDLRSAIQMPTHALPSVLDLVDEQEVVHFPFTVDWSEIAKETVVYFHTSGTTNSPKPCAWTYTHFSTVGARYFNDACSGQPLSEFDMGSMRRPTRRRILVGMGLYHTSMALTLSASIFRGDVTILTPSHISIYEFTPERMVHWIKASRCDSTLMFPSKLLSALNNDEYLAALRKLDFIAFGGAPLDPALAKKLIASTTLCNLWGTTEVTILHNYQVDQQDWEYVYIDAKRNGIEFRDRGGGQYEAVFVRNDNLVCPPQPVFTAFQDRSEFATEDLFEPHSSKPNLWKYVCRTDDRVLLSTAQKIDPLQFERRLLQLCPLFQSVIMLGTGRPRPCLIVELKRLPESGRQLAQTLEGVQAVLDGITAYERVKGHDIIVIDVKRPIPMNEKGTVKRKVLEKLYADDIEALYMD